MEKLIRHIKAANQATTWKAQQHTDAMNQFLHTSEEREKKKCMGGKKRKSKTSEVSPPRELNAHSTYRSINCNRRHFCMCQFMKSLSI